MSQKSPVPNRKDGGRTTSLSDTIGLDNMTGWIQRSLYNQTSNRGALFAEWEGKRRTASSVFVWLSVCGLFAALGHFYLTTDEQMVEEPWDWISIMLKWATLIMYFASIAAWHQLYTIKTRLHALTAFKDEDINSVGFSQRLGMTGMSFASWYRAGVIKEAVVDLIILLPQPLPFVRIYVEVYEYAIHDTHAYHLNWIMTMLMFLRCYFLPRIVADSSTLSSFQARAIGNLNYIAISPSFVLRAYLGQSVVAVCAFFLFLIMCFAFMMLIAEHPMVTSSLHHNLPNCVWLIIITMTTVGYGDLYPVTLLGRTVAVLAAMSAVICTALFVSVVGQRLSLSHQEERVVSVIDRMERSKHLRTTAAQCIGRMWRAYTKRCKDIKQDTLDEKTLLLFGSSKKRTSVTFDHDVAKAVTAFRDLRRSYISDLVELGNETALSKIQFQLTAKLTSINDSVDKQNQRIAVLEHTVQEKLDAIYEAVRRE